MFDDIFDKIINGYIFSKSVYEYLIIFMIVILFLVIQDWIFCKSNLIAENMINISETPPIWKRNKCNYEMNKTLIDELNKNNFKLPKSENDWSVYFPCAYDDISKEVDQMPIIDGGKYFIVEKCDEIVAKELLWKNITLFFGLNKAKTLMPNGYILYDQNDIDKFNVEYDPTKLYIIKKNIQRQEGLKITKNKEEIINAYKNGGYVIVQELLQDPYIINGRKTNMRFYVLVVCKSNEYNVFVYNDGFMYYTKNMFKLGDESDESNITTGYIDRQVYIDNPLTHEDLKKYLDDDKRTDLLDTEQFIRQQNIKISEVYFNRIYDILKEVFLAYSGKFTTNKKFNDTNVCFQIFGVDVAVNNKLNPMIIEVNKGPDIGAKDKRDSLIKHGLISDTFAVVGLIKNKSYIDTNFIQILETHNGNILKNNCSKKI